MTSGSTKQRDAAAPGYLVGALVLAFCLFMGFFVLPRLGGGGGRSGLVGKPAPDFLLPYASPEQRGKTQRLSDLQGKVVVLDFWASWCKACRAQIPALERLAHAVGSDKLVVLGVGTSDDQNKIVSFLEQRPIRYASVYDDEGMASSAYRVQVLPTLVVIAKDGIVRAMTTGVMSEKELNRLVTEAME
jgi:thiol-disulfide isomerase/thioredoxin